MNLQNLESFLEICEQGTLSRAAEALYITQPTLSSRLATLEDELGVPLIDRKKGIHRIEFTKEGLQLAQYTRTLVELNCRTKANLPAQNKAELKLGLSLSLGTYVLPNAIRNFISENMDICLRIRHPLYTECNKMLREGTIDFALFTMCKPEKDISITTLFNEKLMFLCSPGSTFADNMSVDELPVEKEIYIGRWNENGYCSEFVAWHKKHFGKGYPMIETSIVPVIEQYFKTPDTWGIFPSSIAAPYLAQNVVEKRTILGLPKYRPIKLITRKGSELSVASKKFIDTFCDSLSDNPDFIFVGK